MRLERSLTVSEVKGVRFPYGALFATQANQVEAPV